MWKRLARRNDSKGSTATAPGTLKYRVLLQNDPDNLQALSKLGIIYFDSGENEKACELLTKAKALRGRSEKGSGRFWRTLGRALMKRWYTAYDIGWCGQTDEQTNDAESAVDAFEACLKHVENATNPAVYVELGKAYEAYGAYNGAQQAYANVVVNFPSWKKLPRAVFNAAVVSLHPSIMNMEESKRYFEHIMIDPPRPYTENLLLFQLARLYQMMGKRKLARDAFTEVFKKMKPLNKSGHQKVSTWAIDPLMWIAKGDFHCKNKDYILAADALREALRREQPQTSATLYKYALTLKAIGQDTEALENIERAYELDSTYNLRYRNILVKWDAEKWKDQFDIESYGATQVQKITRACWGRLQGLLFMSTERELRLKRHVGAVGFQKLWRGVMDRILAREERVRFIRYKALVSRSLKKMQMQVQLYALKLLRRRVQEINNERRLARERYEKVLMRRNLKRIKQRHVIAAFHGWYNNVQDIIERRWQHKNHMASSIVLFCRFIAWRIERRERERKVCWALNRMQTRWMEEGFHAWDEFRVFSICIKIQRRRTAHRMKKESFKFLQHFTKWNIARKIRLKEKRRLREIRFRHDVRELLGQYDPLLLIKESHNGDGSGSSIELWARKISSDERKLHYKASRCQQSLNFQGRLAVQSGCLNEILPRLPILGESQVSVLEREYELKIRFSTNRSERFFLPSLHSPRQQQKRFYPDVEECTAPPSSIHNTFWPANGKATKLGRLVGSHYSELETISHKSRLRRGMPGRPTSMPRCEQRGGLVPGLLQLDHTNMKSKEGAGMSLAFHQRVREAKYEMNERYLMEREEKHSRTNDAILDNSERVRDLKRFRDCVRVGGQMDEHLFCMTALPGRLYSQMIFKAACRIQLWMLICHPTRKLRHNDASTIIQNAWWDYIDRVQATRELYIRRAVRKLRGDWKRAVLNAWLRAAERQKTVRESLKQLTYRQIAYIFGYWKMFADSQKERRCRLMLLAIRRAQLRRVEHAFEIWHAFREQRTQSKRVMRRGLQRAKRRWFCRLVARVNQRQVELLHHTSAISIQAIVRGHVARIQNEHQRAAFEDAVLLLQRRTRGLIGRKVTEMRRRKRYRNRTIRARQEARKGWGVPTVGSDGAVDATLQARHSEILKKMKFIEALRHK